MTKNYVIYDCDSGTDDCWGLLMLLKGEQLSNSGPDGRGYQILAVTTVHGNSNIENTTRNTLRLLDAAERTDIPLYKGCPEPILPKTWVDDIIFHGYDGFGDIHLEQDWDVDMSLVQPKHAVTAMYEYVCKYPKMVDFILVGPLTNFATCIIMYGEAFLSRVGKIYVMGGNYRAKGNVTKSAEYNFMCDPEAAHIVLENIQTPLVIVPWETCIDGDFGITLDWRFEVIGAVKCKAVELLNKVEGAILKPKGLVNWITCDAIAVATYVFPELAISRCRLYHATVELAGTQTRGQMVLDHLRSKENNANIVMEVDRENYKNIICWTAGLPGYEIK